MHLKSRHRLSVHLKIDTEGALHDKNWRTSDLFLCISSMIFTWFQRVLRLCFLFRFYSTLGAHHSKGVADFHVFSIGICKHSTDGPEGSRITHSRLSVQGAEWEELEWLVSSPSEMDKIRTFDMEDGRQLWCFFCHRCFTFRDWIWLVGLAGPSSWLIKYS